MQKNKATFFILIFTPLIFFDQLTKNLIRLNSGFYVCNKNFAFGISGKQILILIGILSILAFFESGLKITKLKQILNFIKKQKKSLLLFKIEVIFLLAGASSNIFDRLFLGCVIDFIDLKIWPVFNLADIYITIGAGILIVKNVNLNQKI